MRKIILFFALLCPWIAFAAGTPDMPGRDALVSRFNAGDSTLTSDDIAIVYYGACLTPGFAAAPHDYAEINRLRAAGDYAAMMPLCAEALKTDPASLTLLFRSFAGAFNAAERDAALIESLKTRINQVCDAIFASGSGVTETDPYKVAAEPDIDLFINNYLGIPEITDRGTLGHLQVRKVKMENREEPVYLFFEAGPGPLKNKQ